ncbi:MAG: TATA box binding protein associated factor-domain-containing protein [Monoraphidium minutum]|nr:MAG: TATA box binding protein associated factor-domain-containing protein [Monoraphidium minutum]
MSFITPGTVQAIAHSLDIPQLSDEAARALAPDVEYRLREVIQEALKFAKHSKRLKLTTEDVNNALRLRNVEPLYGFGGRDPMRFVRASGHPDLFFKADPERSFSQLIDAPLPKVPRDVGISAHWLAVNGRQPAVPENAPLEQPPPKRPRLDATALQNAAAGGDGGKAVAAAGQQQQQQQQQDGRGGGDAQKGGGKGGGGGGGGAPHGAVVQPPVRHSLSKELQVYFDRLVGLLQAAAAAEAASGALPDIAAAAPPGGAPGAAPPPAGAMPPPAAPPSGGGGGAGGAAAGRADALFRAALASVSSDPGLHPLAPYFAAYIADGVAHGLGRPPLLRRLLALARALLSNPGIRMERYLNQLLPAVATCMLTAQLGPRGGDEHWAVREQAAELAALAARLFGEPYHNVAPRLVRLMAGALMDPAKGFACKYGAAVGLQALGPRTVRTALLPHLEPFVSTVLLPALNGGGADGGSDGGADGGGAAAELELRRREARRLFGALAAAAGAAMYDRIIGLLADRLPQAAVLRNAPAAGGKAAGGGGGDGAPGAPQRAGEAGPSGGASAAKPGAPLVRKAPGGGGGGAGGAPPRSAAEVLADAWKEDSDVDAQLAALTQLFGEDVLAQLPLGELPAFCL